jgi:rhamnose utilization protein RhaD (predicted bifunctional aldolase and dehydrogenase)
MTNAKQLAEAEAQTRRAERAAMNAEIRLAIVDDKIAAHERAEAKHQRALVQSALEQMVKSGAIRADDHAAQLHMAGQLITDPSLIPLSLTPRIFRQRNSKLIQQQNEN